MYHLTHSGIYLNIKNCFILAKQVFPLSKGWHLPHFIPLGDKMLRCALAIFMARGEEVTPTKIGWACAARFLKPLSYLWPKFAFSPPYFTTWSRIWYPIEDLIPCFGSLVQPDVKGIVKGFCWWSYRYRWKRSFIWKNVPNSRLECKNHTLIETKNGQG